MNLNKLKYLACTSKNKYTISNELKKEKRRTARK